LNVGIRLPSFVLNDAAVAPSKIFDYVRSVEELGYDSIFVIDHLLTAAPTYPVTWYDSMSMLSAIASTTRKVRFGPLVLVLPLYHPVQLAKSLATIDYLSNGRLILGLGVGWNREEFDALGVRLSSRGKMMD
jgi:alkanesulfonate monooxygenase SsuD/methylene tetrahydromethanopterin reductase-like flavin-dependent oxidoreductase (luciferase family)